MSSQRSRNNFVAPRACRQGYGRMCLRAREAASTGIATTPRRSARMPSAPSRLGRRLAHHAHREGRGILLGVVHRVVRHHSLALIVILPSGVQVAVEAGEVAAGDLDPDAMTGLEIVAGRER